MSRLKMGVSVEKLRLANPFRISGHVFDGRNAVIVTLDDGTHVGRGEASGVYYIGDDLEQMLAALANARGAIEAGPSRAELRAILPAGGARNAVVAALGELESKRAGRPVWALAGLDAPRPLRTTFTVGADEPARMAADAWLYIESPAGHAPVMTAEWALHRESGTREVRYALYRRVTLAQVLHGGDPA